jgi:hypothetical protein
LIWGVLLLFAVSLAVYRGWHDVSVPYALDYGEGSILWQARNILDSTRAYAPLDAGPLVIWNYTPAYLLVVRALGKLSGDLLWSGRFVSFLCGLGVAGLLAAIVFGALPQRWDLRARLCAAGTAFSFLCIPSVVDWFSLMRVDWLGLLSVYLGVFFFLSSRSTPWKSYVAFSFFVFAILTKQTFIAAPLACFLVTLVLAPGRAIRLALMSSTVGVIAFWVGMRWTHGSFARHLLTYNVHRFSVAHALGGVWQALMEVRLLMVPVAALLLLAVVRARRWQGLKSRLLRSPFHFTLAVEALHWIMALAISFAYGKVGSNVNYFLEWNAALCVLGGMSLGMLLWQALRTPKISAPIAVTLAFPVLLAASALDNPVVLTIGSRSVYEEFRQRSAAYDQLVPFLAATPGSVLSDDMVLLARAGKDVVFEPATMQYVADAGTWDQSAFLHRVAAKEFALILISSPEEWHPRVLAAILQSYQPDRIVGPFRVYRAGPW